MTVLIIEETSPFQTVSSFQIRLRDIGDFYSQLKMAKNVAVSIFSVSSLIFSKEIIQKRPISRSCWPSKYTFVSHPFVRELHV